MKMGYKIEYSDDKVSAWGGFSVMKNFNDKLGLKTILQSLPIPQSTSNNSYESQEIVESFLLSVWLGCYKFSHTHVLRLHGTFTFSHNGVLVSQYNKASIKRE